MPALVDAKTFSKLDKVAQCDALKKHAEYLGNRLYGGQQTHLYAYNGFFVECWCRLGTNQFYWIEIISTDLALERFAHCINIQI